MSISSLFKARTATLMRVLVLALIGCGAALLPVLSSAQNIPIPTWQAIVKATAPSQSGCFQVSYPNTQWQASPASAGCNVPTGQLQPQIAGISANLQPQIAGISANLQPQIAGVSADLQPQIAGTSAPPPLPAAASNGGAIRSAEGSFLNISGVTDIVDNYYGDNSYSLQLNTAPFELTSSKNLCTGNHCQICPAGMGYCLDNAFGWVQFVYMNQGNSITSPLFIWYELDNTGSCPSSWPSYAAYMQGPTRCWLTQGMYIPSQSIAGFNSLGNQVSLGGQTANGMDRTVLTMGTNAYAVITPTVYPEIFQSNIWKQAQFNIFGQGGGSFITVSNGATLTARIKINDGTENAPNCDYYNSSGTAEYASNLYLASPCSNYEGAEPAISFITGKPPALPGRQSKFDL